MTFEKIHLVINPASGQPGPILTAINPALHESGADWSVSVTTQHHDATDLTRAAVENGADVVGVYGGDGTVKSVVNGLMDTSIPLAILHGGTGNALAHELNIPTDLDAAIRLVTGQHSRRKLDVGEIVCEDSPDKTGYFILRSSIGLQNRILEEATPERKQRFGNFAYLMAGLRSLADGDQSTFTLTIDGGEPVAVEGLSCMVANSATVGGQASFVFAPQVAPDDGELDVFVLDTRFDAVVAMMNSSLEANLDQYPNHWRGREIHVELEGASAVTIDGEDFGQTPVDIRVIAQAVDVIVPVQNTDSGE